MTEIVIDDDRRGRFKDAPWFPGSRSEPVLIGGAGGIGSWLAMFMATAGYKPIVYDFDVIEEHNLGGQLFRPEDVGRTKVDAIHDIVYTFRGERITIFENRVDENTPTHHFCMSAFDNMEARKMLFNVWKRCFPYTTRPPIFIDGRLTMEQLQIFCITPNQADWYESEHLFEDSEVEDAPCTMRQTTHTAAMIASYMTAMFTNHIANDYTGIDARAIPRYQEIYLPVGVNIQDYG